MLTMLSNTIGMLPSADIFSVFNNARPLVQNIMIAVIGILGLVLLGVGIIKVVHGFLSDQRRAYNILWGLAMGIVGAFFAYGAYSAWQLVTAASNGTFNTLMH